ncbi:hypothetical protein [Nocardia africana]|uniref:Uncharacterized protein n=1 Tax=Nocardia africana TaxID=134964 RepID=A0ABW6NER7_9NOCA
MGGGLAGMATALRLAERGVDGRTRGRLLRLGRKLSQCGLSLE